MEQKDRIDLLHKTADVMSKQSDVLYKKIFILVALLGGLGTLFFKSDFPNIIQNSIIVIFFMVSIGLFFIYIRISKINAKINNIINKLERIENE